MPGSSSASLNAQPKASPRAERSWIILCFALSASSRVSLVSFHLYDEPLFFLCPLPPPILKRTDAVRGRGSEQSHSTLEKQLS